MDKNGVPEEWLTPTGFHNKAMETSRANENRAAAFRVIEEGLAIYPFDIDLLSDAILYAPVGRPEDWLFGAELDVLSEEGARDCVRDKIDRVRYANDFCVVLFSFYDRWSWRAFTYVTDYLKERRATVLSSRSAVKSTLQRAVDIAREFTRRFPNEDRAYNELAEALVANDEEDEAEKMLTELVFDDGPRRFPLEQCYTTLVDILMKKGDWATARRVARVGQAGNARTQPGASLGYFVFCEALSLDAMLMHDRIDETDLESSIEKYGMRAVEAIRYYQTASSLLEGRKNYQNTIEQRIDLLAGLFGLMGLISSGSEEKDTSSSDERACEQDSEGGSIQNRA